MLKQKAKWPYSREQVVDMLTAHDVHPTQQRVEIAMLLFSRPQHLSADDILARVNRTGHRVSKATVYNTLGLFAEKGLVRQVIVDSSRVFYDSNLGEHHHFYNVDTGELMDIEPGRLALDALPPLPDGTVAEGVDVIIRLRSQGGSR